MDTGDGLPELICLECVDKLNNSFEFRKQCKTSDETLREYLYKSNLSTNDNNEETNYDIKSESSCTINESEFHDTHFIKKDEENDISSQYDDEESKLIIYDGDQESVKEEKRGVLSLKQKDKIDKNKCKSVFEKQKKRTKIFKKQVNSQTKGKRKSKSKDGLPCPKCSQCFELESDLEIHMISHPKTDEIICTKCSKTFSNLAYLRKHVTTHLINKPYKCLYCSKSFANAGGRLSHLRTHTGKIICI